MTANPTISRIKLPPARIQPAHPLLYSRYMKKLLLLALVLPACVVGEGGQTPGGDDDVPPPDPTDPTGISGSIAANQTWTGTVNVIGPTTIESGATVTVMAGTIVNFKAAAGLTIKGGLDVQGTKGAEAQFIPSETQFFQGFAVSGTLTMAYGLQHGGSIVMLSGGTATITDTKMFGAGGDFLIMNGGMINVSYSQIGADLGSPDTTHCNMHFGGTGNMISVTHTNIEGTPFGLMFYGGQSAIFTDNNWDQTATADASWIDSQPGVTGDFSNGYFSGGMPIAKAGATFTINTPSATRLIDAGVR